VRIAVVTKYSDTALAQHYYHYPSLSDGPNHTYSEPNTTPLFQDPMDTTFSDGADAFAAWETDDDDHHHGLGWENRTLGTAVSEFIQSFRPMAQAFHDGAQEYPSDAIPHWWEDPHHELNMPVQERLNQCWTN